LYRFPALVTRLRNAMAALRERTQGRFQRDVLWNFGSLVVLGVSGIGLQLLIARIYGEAALGVFNQVFAAYIVFSQAAVGGIDRSLLRATAEHSGDRERVTTLVAAAAWPTLLLASISTAIFYASGGWVAEMFESPGVATGIAWAAPGLFFFAINKVLLAATNGLRRMRAFAVLNALRFVLILVGLLVAIALDFDSDALGFVFTFSEGLLFLVLAVEVGLQLVRITGREWVRWSFLHLRYGLKSAASGVLLELNSKVDILMVAYFLDDARVGIYAFAANLAEGVFQPLVVLQNNYNPLLAQNIAAGKHAELRAMTDKGKRTSYLLMFGICGCAALVFPLYVMLGGRAGLWDSWLPFAVLMLGMFGAAGYMPFAQTLLMANRPGWHSLMMVGIVLVNVVGNWLFIPLFDIVGAALGTCICLLSSAVFLVGFVRWRVGVRL
jgi:O-antigen/teichoic acid export membrane protein